MRRGKPPNTPRQKPLVPPSGAHHWALLTVRNETREKADGSGNYQQAIRKLVQGPPLEDGTRPESWPVATFSPRAVLEQWGPGKYQVNWYSQDDTKISAETFELDTPPKARAARARQVASRDTSFAPDAGDGEPARQLPGGFAMPQSSLEWMMYSNEREERAAERRRQEAREDDERRRLEYERQADRDRQFMANMMTMLAGNRQSAAEASPDLLRRELALTIREGNSNLRAEVMQTLAQLAADRGNDGADGPKDVGEGVERIGLRMLEELEEAAPEIVEAAIPQIVSFLQNKGWKPSQGFAKALDELRQRQNGASGDS